MKEELKILYHMPSLDTIYAQFIMVLRMHLNLWGINSTLSLPMII